MTEHTNASPGVAAHGHEAETHAPYLRVWAALAVFTAIEYFYAFIFKDYFVILLLGLLLWAVIKAGLVGWYFMHLKFEGPWVYILIVPAFVLATILVLACTPDMSARVDAEESPEEVAALGAWPDSERPAQLVLRRASACSRVVCADMEQERGARDRAAAAAERQPGDLDRVV
jgi:cytochrome c oxidase subunit 4